MAVFRILTQKWSFTNGPGGCLSWCFGTNQNKDPSADSKNLDPKNEKDYGTTSLDEKDGKPKANGSAYAYEDAETSSDSDDEVLRRYQQQIQRVPSNRSLKSNRSARSHRSSASKASKGSKRNGRATDDPKLISQAEKGQVSSPEVSGLEDSDPEVDMPPVTATSTPFTAPRPDDERISVASSVRKTGSQVTASVANGEGSSAVSSHHSRDPAVAHFEEQVEQYQNEGFQPEEASPEHHSATSSEHGMSAFGDAASMSVGEVGDEHLFDVSDLQDREPALISKCGTLEVVFNYSAIKAKMAVKIGVARDIPTKERGGASNVQVRLLLLPTKKTRHKTKIKPGEAPEFNETFEFKVPPEEVNNMGIRLRLYGTERMRRERMIGEAVVGFASVNQDTETTHWVTLEPRSNLSGGDSKLDLSSLSRSDSASSTQSIQHGGMPELLIGLAYNGTTGRLSVEVIKGSNFRNMAMNRAPDTYVKLTLMSPNGQEIARSKTSIRRGQPNPLYKETFMFQVALFQLPDVTLMVSVYNKRSMKRKEMIGWFSLGLNNSGEEELGHWNDMRESKGEQVCRWHVLLES